MTPEGLVKRAICDHLKARQIFFWINQAGKMPGRKLAKVGITDILGIYKGKFLAIEVKSAKGSTTLDQIIFMREVRAAGGIAFVARSVLDVERELTQTDRSE